MIPLLPFRQPAFAVALGIMIESSTAELCSFPPWSCG
jgi:hypothetical protein